MQCQHRGVREDLGHAFKSRFLPPQIQVTLCGWELLTEDKVALSDPQDFESFVSLLVEEHVYAAVPISKSRIHSIRDKDLYWFFTVLGGSTL